MFKGPYLSSNFTFFNIPVYLLSIYNPSSSKILFPKPILSFESWLPDIINTFIFNSLISVFKKSSNKFTASVGGTLLSYTSPDINKTCTFSTFIIFIISFNIYSWSSIKDCSCNIFPKCKSAKCNIFIFILSLYN